MLSVTILVAGVDEHALWAKYEMFLWESQSV